MVKVIYAFFLGILLAIFIGVGISVFYAEPTPPKAPEFSYVGKDGLNQQQQAQEQAFEKTRQDYEKNKLQPYNRNVSIIALISAVIFVTIGLLLEHKINVLADGTLLGGVFTLLYSLGRGFAAQDNKYSFIVVSIGLLIVLALGYLRFIRPAPKKA